MSDESRKNHKFISAKLLIGLVFVLGLVSSYFALTSTPKQGLLQSSYFYIVDLDNDGVELIDYNDSTVLYDVDGDGYAEKTSWVGQNEGFLVVSSIHEEQASSFFQRRFNGFVNIKEKLLKADANNDDIYNSADYLEIQMQNPIKTLVFFIVRNEQRNGELSLDRRDFIKCDFQAFDFKADKYALDCGKEGVFPVKRAFLDYSDDNLKWDSVCSSLKLNAANSVVMQNDYKKFCLEAPME
ncbi:MAG: hypothetical protein VYC19_02270 [Pseudomonadota bacterium]|nr:hypothetical protein [Pseudomonadota bacterium]